MPYTTDLTEDYLGIIQTGSGVVTGREILQGCRTVTALVQTTENFEYKLVDFSSVSDLQIGEDELAAIVEEDRLIARSRPHAAIVLVVPNDEIEALATHWQEMVAELGWDTHIACSRADAQEWLRARHLVSPVES
jgi:hypothetical protein